MSITLYTAPDCIRCKIVKAFLAERNIEYGTVDFKENAQEFNTFYRTNRKAIYRNPEGVEFPLFFDGETVKQGSGEIIAYLLSLPFGAVGVWHAFWVTELISAILSCLLFFVCFLKRRSKESEPNTQKTA